MRLTILMPVRDDWESAGELIQRLDCAIPSCLCHLEILMVDDGSSEPQKLSDFRRAFAGIRAVRTLRLRRNLGHQRAIAVGLAHLESARSADAVLVMDADGEDTAEGALELIRTFVKSEGALAVFAERSRRTESTVFRVFYVLYKIVHRALTGLSVRVGNFSILPAKYLSTLVVVPEMWNHYAAAVFRSRLPLTMIPIPRGYRIAGKSRMNFVSLVMHGLSALSVFGDVVGVRILLVSAAGLALVAAAVAGAIAMRLFTRTDIPDWVIYACGTLGILFVQLLAVIISFTFFTLSSRMNLGFLPVRDYSYFVAETVHVFPCEE